MPYAELDRLRLYYERAGSGEPELLFVPGGAAIALRSARSSSILGAHTPSPHSTSGVAVRATVRRTAMRFPTWPTILRDSAPRSGSTSRLLSGIASAE